MPDIASNMTQAHVGQHVITNDAQASSGIIVDNNTIALVIAITSLTEQIKRLAQK